jgi:hypothetical protein
LRDAISELICSDPFCFFSSIEFDVKSFAASWDVNDYGADDVGPNHLMATSVRRSKCSRARAADASSINIALGSEVSAQRPVAALGCV